ncbi:hypothetical protein TRIUR3_15125 [Triticum urartu]|uniref:DUF6598 domain-containing protein n=1 Tax=Triticum urartu TaxID=4572 RepID=M7ZB96_TRIUA|nr:hypothetical protein TRIUR3_15125 [Triticum urartu]
MASPAAGDHHYLFVCTHGDCQLRDVVSHEFAEDHRRHHEREDDRRRSELAHAKRELEVRRTDAQRHRGRRKASSLESSSGETGCDEHVGDTTQPPSAHAVQELVDSFSNQLPGRIDDKGKSPMGIFVEAKDLVSYTRDWENSWGGEFGSFEYYSNLRTTHLVLALRASEPCSSHADPPHLMQVSRLACRSSPSESQRSMMLLSGHSRSMAWWAPETPGGINATDPLLTLTGPSRAIVFTGPVDVEIQLRLKGRTTEHEDKDLISKVLVYGRDPSDKFADAGIGNHDIMHSSCSSELCSLQVTSALLAGAVEATVICAKVIQGRWPKNLGIRIVARSASIDEDLVLLDARDGTFRVDLADGIIALSRHVVCVEKDGRLKLCIEAYSKRSGCMYEKSDVTELVPKRSSASLGRCKLAFCTVQFTVPQSPHLSDAHSSKRPGMPAYDGISESYKLTGHYKSRGNFCVAVTQEFQEYRTAFHQRVYQVRMYEGVGETMLVTQFILGLKEEIHSAVEIQLPSTIAIATQYALQVLAGGDKRRSGVVSDTSTTAGLSGMEQRGLAGGRVMMDERRMVAWSGVVVASTVAVAASYPAAVLVEECAGLLGVPYPGGQLCCLDIFNVISAWSGATLPRHHCKRKQQH